MHSEDGVHMGIFHHAGGYQLPRAAGHQILAGLENKLYRSGELVPHVAQRSGNAQQHGGVQVMAAGVHHALVPTGKGQTRVLIDRQGVDIGPQAHAFAGTLLAVEQAHNGGGQRGLDLVHPHFLQLGADQCAGTHLL